MASVRAAAARARSCAGAASSPASDAACARMKSFSPRARNSAARRAVTSPCSAGAPPSESMRRSVSSCSCSLAATICSTWRWSRAGSRPGCCATAAAMNSAAIHPSPPAADSRPPSRAWIATFRPGDTIEWCPHRPYESCHHRPWKVFSLGRRASHLGRLRRRLGRLLGRRTHLAAALAQLEAVTAQLVAPVLALERPEHLVVLDLRRVAAARGRGTGLLRRRCGQLLLAAPDLQGKAQRRPEPLAQLPPPRLEPREELAAGALDQLRVR